MSLAINLATRGRPQLLLDTIMKTVSCVSRADTVFMVSVDADDQATIDMLAPKDAPPALGGRLRVSIKEREDTIAAKWNRVLREVDADVYMTMCDDRPVVTPGFDQMILDAAALFPDGIGVVTNYLENLTFPGIQAVTLKWAQIVGFIFPELFPYWFVDHWLLDLIRMTGREAFAPVRLDAAVTPPTMEKRELPFWATVYDAFYLERRRQAEAILAQCNNAGWWAGHDMVRSKWPAFEQHSKMINDQCRGARDMGPEPDERYLRLKREVQRRLAEELPAIEADQVKAAA